MISAISADVLAVRHSSPADMHLSKGKTGWRLTCMPVGEGGIRRAYHLISLQRRLFNTSSQANGLASSGAGQGRTERIRCGRVDINTQCHPEIPGRPGDPVQTSALRSGQLRGMANNGTIQTTHLLPPTACGERLPWLHVNLWTSSLSEFFHPRGVASRAVRSLAQL
jgi:hypothetical protein